MENFLGSLKNFIVSNKFNIYRVSQIHDGKIETAELIQTNRCQDVYSVAKTFTVTAIGLLFDRGLVKVEDKFTDIFPEIKEYIKDERWNDITVEHLLKHKSGFPGTLLDIDTFGSYGFDGESDYLKYAAGITLDYDPGTSSSYNDGGYYLLARIVEKLAHKTEDILLNEEFFSVIKCPEFAFTKTPLNHVVGASGLYIHSSTMVKMGLLYLNGGVIDGKRILSEEWCDLVLSRHYEFTPRCDGKALGKAGMNGQMLLIIPRENRVVAWQGYQWHNSDILGFISEGIK